VTMDDAELLRRMWASMHAAFELVPPLSGGRVERLDGVVASVVPAVPDRSVFNSVFYEDGAALERAYDELAGLYDRSGVTAWTVWAHPGDERAARALEQRGHVLDAEPAAMGMELDRGHRPPPPELAWRPARDAAELGDLNDRAYGHADAPFSRGFGKSLPAEQHTYVAEADGAPAACVAAIDAGGDCSIVWVATLPEARGRGLASGLMLQALADARERGCETSSLQATKLGRPVYERLGYRALGTLQMWELRKA
jgi:GNAT superfamily N-acetyltransferase